MPFPVTPHEYSRLEFIEHRDGVTGAIDFCRRTLPIYRSAVLRSLKRGFKKPSHASTPAYRASFIHSYVILKRYLRERA